MSRHMSVALEIAINTDMDDNETFSTRGNGWTKYQQLVLSELKRHEMNQLSLQNELRSLQIAHAKYEVEMTRGIEETKKLSSKVDSLSDDIAVRIEKMTSTLESKMEHLDDAREATTLDLSKVKWKIGTFATALGMIGTAIVEGIVKLFWPSGH